MAAVSGRRLRAVIRSTAPVAIPIGILVCVLVLLSDSSIFPITNLQRKNTYNRAVPNRASAVDAKYRWMEKRNFLPNFYTRPTDAHTLTRWPPDGVYANSTIVFVHNQKSGGSTAKNCLKDIMEYYDLQPPMLAANPNAEEFYSEMLSGGSSQVLAKSYMGDSSFGICDFSSQPCSYFTVLRDPYERVISSHNMCKLTVDQAQCIVRNATQLTLKEWAIHQGSFFFRQLLTNPVFFTKQYAQLVDKLRKPEDPPTEMIPPWWRSELILNQLMDERQKTTILDYVLDNLESWFAVIGLTSDYDTNLLLFQRAFRLPFYNRCAGAMSNKRQYKLAGQNFDTSRQEVLEKLHRELTSDPDVNRALYYDVEIYKRAKDIYRRQKLAYNQMLHEVHHLDDTSPRL